MRSFEDILNVVSDMDQNWWPFLFMRPERHQKITIARTAFMAILYGVFAGTLVNALIKLGGAAAHLNPIAFPLGSTLGFFVLFRLTFAYGWNQRAARMVPHHAPRPDVTPDPEAD